jgi:hypothetical protein
VFGLVLVGSAGPATRPATQVDAGISSTSPDDGTDYTSPGSTPGERTEAPPPPLPDGDPYEFSADPDGSMAADEAQHYVGPFDPAYSEEYLPDPGSDDPTDPESPENANRGPPPGPDTTDTSNE